MGLGIAEERHHAIAKIFGDVAVIAGYGFGRSPMIRSDDLAPFLRVEPRGYFCRTDQIAKTTPSDAAAHHEQAPLRVRHLQRSQALSQPTRYHIHRRIFHLAGWERHTWDTRY
jgi:hypothetical protein